MSDIPTGRALDATVAEQVMGWIPCLHRVAGGFSAWATIWACQHTSETGVKPCDMPMCFPSNPDALHHPHSALPRFSTDIASAWQVVELFRRGWQGHSAASVMLTCWDVVHAPDCQCTI